ncbi:hypothetical protein DL767_003880 [Monosporascus sp. MG133]|nr:hypothetical protein DL767_003880 [Monosporascus sp. MG133]
MVTEQSGQKNLARPRDWKAGVDDYLREHGIVFEKATPLDGGTSCYLWRLDGLNDAEASSNGYREGEPAVMKCADSMAKGGPVAVAPDRLQVEVKALKSKAVAEACRQEPSVRVPSVLRETHNGFIMSWAGETDLRKAYQTDNSMDVSTIGARLGRWLACLHHAGIPVGPDGWSTQHDILEKMFSGPGGLEEQAVRSVLRVEDEVERVLKLTRTPSPVRTLTPWDFRPSNVVLRMPSEKGAAPDMTIVDWELCHYGDPSNDLRMWVAEAMIMEAQHGNRGLLSSFLTAYRRQAGSSIIDKAFVRKVAVAVGVFLLYFIGQGAVLWGFTEKDNEQWTEKAIQYLKAGADDDIAWLGQSSLKPLLD